MTWELELWRLWSMKSWSSRERASGKAIRWSRAIQVQITISRSGFRSSSRASSSIIHPQLSSSPQPNPKVARWWWSMSSRKSFRTWETLQNTTRASWDSRSSPRIIHITIIKISWIENLSSFLNRSSTAWTRHKKVTLGNPPTILIVSVGSSRSQWGSLAPQLAALILVPSGLYSSLNLRTSTGLWTKCLLSRARWLNSRELQTSSSQLPTERLTIDKLPLSKIWTRLSLQWTKIFRKNGPKSATAQRKSGV